jgi:hypothetical protein
VHVDTTTAQLKSSTGAAAAGSSGLSGGGIAGIVVGSVAAVAVVAVIVLAMLRVFNRKGGRHPVHADSPDAAGNTPTTITVVGANPSQPIVV